MSGEEILGILRAKLPDLRAEFGVKRIGIFGSYATGSATDESDVDIVVVFERPVGLGFIRLAEYLESLLGRKTDVLTPVGISAIRNKAIVERIKGSIVYV